MNYYVFALFIFLLLCAALIVGRLLFGDTRRQKKILDEKETKLLQLYETLEEGMEDFYATTQETKQELEQKLVGTIDQLEQFKGIIAAAADRERLGTEPPQPRRRPARAPVVPPEPEPAPAAQVEPIPQPAAQTAAQPAAVQLEPEERPAPVEAAAAQQVTRIAEFLPQEDTAREGGPTKQEQILALAQEGSSPKQIAEQLEITMSEVDLVLGMVRTGQK